MENNFFILSRMGFILKGCRPPLYVFLSYYDFFLMRYMRSWWGSRRSHAKREARAINFRQKNTHVLDNFLSRFCRRAWFYRQAKYLTALDPAGTNPNPSMVQVQPWRDSGSSWESLGRVWRSSGRALGGPRPHTLAKVSRSTQFQERKTKNKF